MYVCMYVCMFVRELLLDRWADLLHILGTDASHTGLTYKLYFMTLNERSRSPEASTFDLFVYASWKVLAEAIYFTVVFHKFAGQREKHSRLGYVPKTLVACDSHCNYNGSRMQPVFLGRRPGLGPKN